MRAPRAWAAGRLDDQTWQLWYVEGAAGEAERIRNEMERRYGQGRPAP